MLVGDKYSLWKYLLHNCSIKIPCNHPLFCNNNNNFVFPFFLFLARWLYLCYFFCFVFVFSLFLMYFFFLRFFRVWRSTCNFIIFKQDWSGILLARVEAYTPNQGRKNKKRLNILYVCLWFHVFFMIHTFYVVRHKHGKSKKIFTVVLEWRLRKQRKKNKIKKD